MAPPMGPPGPLGPGPRGRGGRGGRGGRVPAGDVDTDGGRGRGFEGGRAGRGRGRSRGDRAGRGAAAGDATQQPPPPPPAVAGEAGAVPDAAAGALAAPVTEAVQLSLPAMLANATPEQQKQILGERLFPQVQALQPELAGKITGMLLEMDNSEVLLLLDNQEALVAKVDEAIEVLKQHNAIPEGQAE